MTKRKTGLKRGLDALLAPKAPTAEGTQTTTSQTDSDLRNLPVEFLQPGKYQPRKDMTEEGLDELAESIKAQGVIQPIVVRSLLGNEKFEIIAGERRWRAAQKAGLHEVPTIIKEVDDNAAIAMSLIENIQREDLNAIEEAVALSRLKEEFELTHQEVADAVGKSRAAVTNLMRLLSLVESVRLLIEHGDLEMGHGRALLALSVEQQAVLAKLVVEKGMSVRETEALVKKQLNPTTKKQLQQKSSDIKLLERNLSEHLGSPALLQHGRGGKGKLVLQYSSLAELDGILAKMGMPKG
ncbi:MAG: ParB/RepB/Spo0J family partition protein [Gammaproteobacteria bacterium]|nr:ParB/RepB/Spo0J family partition protein [Gammaproteobacteria bacterium]NNJ71640.1 ParB/RepB/Spo0J family partition protein [Enterobacterales bacterium]